jgi:outer membrane protein OmpA-like peptidoglycan-associated protein
MDSKGFFTVNGSDILGHNDISFGLVIDYGNTLLRVADVGQKSPQLINHSFQGTAQFNYGLFNQVVLGLDLPVVLMAGDEQITKATPPAAAVAGWQPGKVDEQSFEYVGLHAKWRILRVEHGFGLAIGLGAGVPISDARTSGGADPTAWAWPQIMLEKHLGATGRFKLGLNGGFRAHGASKTVLPLVNGSFKDGNRLTYGAAASFRILEPVDLVAETYATYLLSDATSAVKPSNEVVGGIKVFVERNSYLMIGAGPRYTNGFEAADLRGFIGFIFEPSIGDRDGDGIKDDLDKCPDDPEDFDGFHDEDGCPDPDNDMDGILDKKDACPNDPEDKDGFQDEDGCPDPDNDKDGILDKVDRCPNEPETFNGFEDEDGCPDKGDVLIKDNDIMILKKIKFKTASAEILPESNPILDAVATTIVHHPEFVLMEVAGHADERSDDQYNLRLTQDRVNSVMAALVNRGVDRARLRSKGYGEYCPEDPGHNDAAWETNRRVEFKIVKTKDGPTGVELGCQVAVSKGVRPDPVP